jgi:hypothetical protein
VVVWRLVTREIAMADWKSDYEDAADREAAQYVRMSADELLLEIQAGRTGEYHTIWRAVASRGTPSQVAWPLYDVLRSERPYLDRYHCAMALLRALNCTEFEAVALSANWPTRPRDLSRLEDLIARSVGGRGQAPG